MLAVFILLATVQKQLCAINAPVVLECLNVANSDVIAWKEVACPLLSTERNATAMHFSSLHTEEIITMPFSSNVSSIKVVYNTDLGTYVFEAVRIEGRVFFKNTCPFGAGETHVQVLVDNYSCVQLEMTLHFRASGIWLVSRNQVRVADACGKLPRTGKIDILKVVSKEKNEFSSAITIQSCPECGILGGPTPPKNGVQCERGNRIKAQ